MARRSHVERHVLRELVVAALFGAALGACRSEKPAPVFSRESVLEKLRPDYPGVSLPADALPAGVTARERLVYSRRGGRELELELDVYSPASGGAHPAVLVVHGGGWESGDRTMERPFAKRLAGLGFVAVPVSYGLGADGRFPQPVVDLKRAVRWLRAGAERYGIDPNAIGVVGGSAGGELAAFLGATNGVARFDADADPSASSDVQAVVDIDGLADFTGPALLEKEAREPGAPTRFLGGGFREREAVWRDASPITHVGPKSAPMLFIESGAARPILPGRIEMCVKLRAVGVHCERNITSGAPHPFWLVNPWFEPTLRASATFFQTHLVSRDGTTPVQK